MLFLKRLWNSPTLTTWGSFGARSLGLVIVLPLVLKRFTTAEVALWQVFFTLIGLQLLAEAGLGTTFSRLVAYAMGGATQLENSPTELSANAAPNWNLIIRLTETLRAVYANAAWILGAALLVGGTLSLIRRVEALPQAAYALERQAKEARDSGDPERARQLDSSASRVLPQWQAWTAWGLVLATTVITFRMNAYGSLLQGMNHVALVRRWETAFSMLGIITSLLVLLLKGNLFLLIAANQTWVLASAIRNRWLARTIVRSHQQALAHVRIHKDIFAAVWPRAWRAGLGATMSYGLVQFSSLIVAQSRDDNRVASYLLGMRLIQLLSQASQAPFYSKLPVLATQWARGQTSQLLAIAARAMQLSTWAFVLPWAFLGFCGPLLLERLDTHTAFPSTTLWILLGVATLLERYGAMHLQLYSLTNHIVWHIANGVTGALFVAISVFGFPFLGIMSIPVGLLIGNLCFYAPYCSILSHKYFQLQRPSFDVKTTALPSVLILVYILFSLARATSH